MNRTIEDVEGAAEVTLDAAKCLEGISNETGKATKLNQQLTDAMAQVGSITAANSNLIQSMDSEMNRINDAIDSIAASSQENSASTEEMSASAQEMSAQVQELVASVHDVNHEIQEMYEAIQQARAAADRGSRSPGDGNLQAA
jgi:methyl-accepting chemotaxis protein